MYLLLQISDRLVGSFVWLCDVYVCCSSFHNMCYARSFNSVNFKIRLDDLWSLPILDKHNSSKLVI